MELRLTGDDTLFVHGAAGTFAVQLAQLAGATVVGTASAANPFGRPNKRLAELVLTLQ